MDNQTQHDRMVSHLRGGLVALAGHVTTPQEVIESYLTSSETPSTDVGSES